jgi:HK97 family phage major capsid protein
MNTFIQNRGPLENKGIGNDDEQQSQVKNALAELAQTVNNRVTRLEAQFKEAQSYADQMEAKMNRQALGGGGSAGFGGAGESSNAYTKALSTLVRTGDDRDLKTMSVGSDPDGGYVVIPARSDGMTKKLFDISPIRRLARVETITTGDAWEEPVDAQDVGAQWIGENDGRPETQTAKLGLLRVPVNETYALQPITQRLIDDAMIDVGAWCEDKIGNKFARQEGTAFVLGDGVDKPQGFLVCPTALTTDATRPWGTTQHLMSGDATAIKADSLRDMVWGLRAPYRTGAAWLMNSNTANAIDKLKDLNGDYIWRDSSAAGVPPTLLGYPVEFSEDMPDIAAGSLPIALANWKRAYVVVDKLGIKILRDPYSDKPKVLIYAYKRVGGGLANSEAIKLMKIGV